MTSLQLLYHFFKNPRILFKTQANNSRILQTQKRSLAKIDWMTYDTVHHMRSIYRCMYTKGTRAFFCYFLSFYVIRLRKGLQKCEKLDSIFCLLYRVCLGQRLTFYPIQAFHVFSPSISSGCKMDGSGFKEVFVFSYRYFTAFRLKPHNVGSLRVKKIEF